MRLKPRGAWWFIPMVILCFLTLGGSQILLMWIHSFVYRRRMAKAGRCLTLAEASARCHAGQGFIIQETMGGWPVCRLWWADDDHFIEPPKPAPRNPNYKAHRANYERYLDPERGVALLVSPFHLFRSARRTLQAHFPATTPKWIDGLLATPDEDPESTTRSASAPK